MDKNGKTQWSRKFPYETRLGFKANTNILNQSVHIIGGISWRGATKLMIFTGKCRWSSTFTQLNYLNSYG
jgi:hypothetical protein